LSWQRSFWRFKDYYFVRARIIRYRRLRRLPPTDQEFLVQEISGKLADKNQPTVLEEECNTLSTDVSIG
jgi:hypothetical protein